MTEAVSLRLVALESEDLQVFSAHTQDAVMRIADMAYLPKSQRFAMILNRFNWLKLDANPRHRKKSYERRRSALNFDRVLAVQIQNLNLSDAEIVLELLTIEFVQTNAPAGQITLIFSGDGAIRLDVECIEAQLEDLGAVWSTSRLPEHSFEDQDDNTQNNEGP